MPHLQRQPGGALAGFQDTATAQDDATQHGGFHVIDRQVTFHAQSFFVFAIEEGTYLRRALKAPEKKE
jgi:hypothetical protein